MDFDLSVDQAALQEEARRLLDRYSGPAQVRAHLASGPPSTRALWTAMAEQGWPAVAVAEAHGGLGLGWVEAAVLLEEVGRHTAPVPYAPSCSLSTHSPTATRTPVWSASLDRRLRHRGVAWSGRTPRWPATATGRG